MTTILEFGKASIMEERYEAGGIGLAILERSQLAVGEVTLLKEVGATG